MVRGAWRAVGWQIVIHDWATKQQQQQQQQMSLETKHIQYHSLKAVIN